MSIENLPGAQDAEKLRKTEAEQKAEIAKSLEFTKDKEVLFAKIDQQKQLSFLKSLVERGLIGVGTAELMLSGQEIVGTEVEEIFDKIDEIEQVHNVDHILPVHLRLTKDEYLTAIADPTARANALQKLDQALTHLFELTNAHAHSPLDFFYSFFTMLNKNLVVVQENTIDMKRSLSK
ncbi:MAG: hypothetical protein ACOYN2_04870 [Patescibacteria group bacterium]